MEKLAMIKQAEVNGVMAALLETELVKVASEEDFDAVTSCITDGLSDDYDMEEVLAKTAEVLDEYYALCEEGEEAGEVKKEASEEGVDETAVMAAIGELTLAKVAGDISEEDYDAEVEKLAGAKFDALKNLGKSAKGKASNLGAFLSSGAKGKGIKQGFGKAKGNLGLAKKYKQAMLSSKAFISMVLKKVLKKAVNL